MESTNNSLRNQRGFVANLDQQQSPTSFSLKQTFKIAKMVNTCATCGQETDAERRAELPGWSWPKRNVNTPPSSPAEEAAAETSSPCTDRDNPLVPTEQAFHAGDFPPLGRDISPCARERRPAAAGAACANVPVRRRRKIRRLSGQEIEKVLGLQVEMNCEYGDRDCHEHEHEDPDLPLCYNSTGIATNSRPQCLDSRFDSALDVSEEQGWEETLVPCTALLPKKSSHARVSRPLGERARKPKKVGWSFLSRQKLPSSLSFHRSWLRISAESAAVMNRVSSCVIRRDRWLPTTARSARRFLHKHNSEDAVVFEEGSALHRCVTHIPPPRLRDATAAKSHHVSAKGRKKQVPHGIRCPCETCAVRFHRRQDTTARKTTKRIPIVMAGSTYQASRRRKSYRSTNTFTSSTRGPPRRPVKFEYRATNGRALDVDTALARALETLQHREIRPEDYDLLLQLDAQVPNKTAPDTLVSKLPTSTFTPDSSEPAGPCSVCMELYSAGETLAKLPCGHSFHKDCIERWLLNSSPNCPLDGLPLE